MAMAIDQGSSVHGSSKIDPERLRMIVAQTKVLILHKTAKNQP